MAATVRAPLLPVLIAASAVLVAPSVLPAPALLAAGASAQEVVEVSPGETVVIERYVREAPEPPPVIEEHMTLRPGSIVPEAVPLRRFEGQAALERYAFFVSVDGKIVVVDPRSRAVVRILDKKS